MLVITIGISYGCIIQTYTYLVSVMIPNRKQFFYFSVGFLFGIHIICNMICSKYNQSNSEYVHSITKVRLPFGPISFSYNFRMNGLIYVLFSVIYRLKTVLKIGPSFLKLFQK